MQSSEDSPADTRPSHLAKAFCATPYLRLFPSIRCRPLTLTLACLPDTVTSLLLPILVVHYVSQATNRGFYLPHVPGLPPPPKAEERPLATALKQLIFGVSSPDVSFARVMCSQTHEKVPHCILRHTENAEDRTPRDIPQRMRPSHCATMTIWHMTVHTLLLGWL